MGREAQTEGMHPASRCCRGPGDGNLEDSGGARDSCVVSTKKTSPEPGHRLCLGEHGSGGGHPTRLRFQASLPKEDDDTSKTATPLLCPGASLATPIPAAQ